MKRKILIIGATSAIAQEVCRRLSLDGDTFFLVARNPDHLKIVEADLKAQSPHSVLGTLTLDLNDIEQHENLLSTVCDTLGHIDIALIAYGTLPNQSLCQNSVKETLAHLHNNAISTIALLSLLANVFEKQQQGSIVFLSSVAADRGRASNYVYGAGKSAVNTFLQGLRHRLAYCGITVSIVKPGPVITPMTAHLKKGIIWAQPKTVAKDIINTMNNKKPTLYTPWLWLPIMSMIKLLPQKIFNRLNF